MTTFAAYKDTAVTTQSKGRLVVMLYEGAIKFMKLAIKEIQAGNYQEKGKYINRAVAIFNELNSVLNFDADNELAANLRDLYVFMNKQLNSANIECDCDKIKEVINLAENLNESWKAITT
jgi:flagellar protein FliS